MTTKRKRATPALPVLDALMAPLMKPSKKAKARAAHAAIVANATPVKTEHAPAVQAALDKHDALQPPKGLTRAQRAEFDRAKAVGRKAILAAADSNPPVLAPVAPKLQATAVAEAVAELTPKPLKDPPPIPRHVLQAEALCPPSNENERTKLYQAAKDAWDYEKAFGIKPPLLDLFEAYRKTANGQRSFRFEDPSEASEPTTNTTGAKTMATKKTTTNRAPKVPATDGPTFYKNDKQLARNTLSFMAWSVGVKTADLLKALAKQGIGEPATTAWSATVNGVEVAAKMVRGAKATPAATQKAPKASPKAKAAKAAPKKANATTATQKAVSAEGNGSLTRATVTPIPKAKNAKATKAAATAAKTTGKKVAKRVR